MHQVIRSVGSAGAAVYEFYLRLVTASERPPSFVLVEVAPAAGAEQLNVVSCARCPGANQLTLSSI